MKMSINKIIQKLNSMNQLYNPLHNHLLILTLPPQRKYLMLFAPSEGMRCHKSTENQVLEKIILNEILSTFFLKNMKFLL